MKQLNKNKGFSLVELLISMALLSIVMLMVVQFMSSSTRAQQKTQNSLKVQTVANETIKNMSEGLMGANYIKITTSADGGTATYTVNNVEGTDPETRAKAVSGTSLTNDKKSQVTFALASDDYCNRIKKSGDERKVILEVNTGKFLSPKGVVYGSDDKDLEQKVDVRSTRVLKKSGKFYYIKPSIIYAEYSDKGTDSGGKPIDITRCVAYRFVYDGSKLKNIYMYRSPENVDIRKTKEDSFTKYTALIPSSGKNGLLTESAKDFYLSADCEGNALLFDAVFDVDGYRYKSVDTVKFRNTNVLSVRPQNMYIKTGSDTTEAEEKP